MKIGLVGFGRWGQEHASRWAQLRGEEFSALLTPSIQEAEAALKMYPWLKVYGSFEEFLAADLGIIDIVAPNYLHADFASRALISGRNVILEKPAFTSLEEYHRLEEAVRRGPGVLSMNHRYRCSHTWGVVKAFLESGVLGAVQNVRIALSRKPYLRGFEDWRYRPELVRSWVLEEAIHFMDLIFWYLDAAGKPAEVWARGENQPTQPQLMRSFVSTLAWADGRHALYSHNTSNAHHQKNLEIIGERGSLRYSWLWDNSVTERLDVFREGVLLPAPDGWRAEYGDGGDLLQSQLARTYRAIESGYSELSLREVAPATLTCLEIEQRLREGR